MRECSEYSSGESVPDKMIEAPELEYINESFFPSDNATRDLLIVLGIFVFLFVEAGILWYCT